MQKNEIVRVTVEDIGINGEGIGRVNGYTLFIKDSLIGDTVEAKVLKAKKHYGYAKLLEILSPSPDRVTAKCKFARKCGGCQIQEMKYEKQLEFKQRKVRESLERIGGFDSALLDKVTAPIVGMDTDADGEPPFAYRNKAQFPVGQDREGNPVTGFYAGRTHHIIANTDCPLGVKENRDILEIILNFMREYHISAYQEKTGEGLFRHVLIRCGFRTKEMMVCLVINGSTIPHSEALVERLRKIENIKSITVSPNTKQTNVIMGNSCAVLWGKGYITDYIGDVEYEISPLSFYQVNPVQTEKLYRLALDYAQLTGKETVWDLYCGIGTISLFLSGKASQVCGVEVVPQAIEDARRNARRNGIGNVKFYVGKAEEILPAYDREYRAAHPGQEAYADVIVMDPPRKGCDETLLQTVVGMRPQRIVYVSCDPATLARDLKYLCREEYALEKVRAVDMFPHTVHVETVVLLSHKKPNNQQEEFDEREGK